MGSGGWYGSDEEWRRIEAPLKSLDLEVERFATVHALVVTRNLRDWPSRSMEWDHGVRCLIQLYLEAADTLGLNLWICASQDRALERYWRHEMLCKDVSAEALMPRLSELLSSAKRELDQWSLRPDQLEFATKIAAV